MNTLPPAASHFQRAAERRGLVHNAEIIGMPRVSELMRGGVFLKRNKKIPAAYFPSPLFSKLY